MSSTPRGSDDWEHVLSEAAREAIEGVLDPAESVDFVAPAVGSSLVLTERRLIIVRDGANFRPKSGVRSFELETGLSIRVGPKRRHVIVESARASDQPVPPIGSARAGGGVRRRGAAQDLHGRLRAPGSDGWVEVEGFVVGDV